MEKGTLEKHHAVEKTSKSLKPLYEPVPIPGEGEGNGGGGKLGSIVFAFLSFSFANWLVLADIIALYVFV